MAVIATGFFDGVHLGHRAVIQTLVSLARQRHEEARVITFAHHPRAVLQQDARSLRLLSSMEEKVSLIRALGVDGVEVLPFTREFAALTAEEYLRDVVMARCSGTAVLLGHDNRFGSDSLSPEEIASVARRLGLDTFSAPVSSMDGGIVVSSTKIRTALEAGDVALASEMLGRPYSLRGAVVGGKQLGRTLGFPTANMSLYDPLKAIPARGVYLVGVEVCGRQFHGMCNVGDIIETHIFGFDEDIYGLDIEVRFLRRLRDMLPFGSLGDLAAKLAADAARCAEILRGSSY